MTRCLQTLAALALALSTTSSGASPPAPDKRSERAGPGLYPVMPAWPVSHWCPPRCRTARWRAAAG